MTQTPAVENIHFSTTDGSTTESFILKLDTNGIFQWVKFIEGNGVDNVEDKEFDTSNNIYILQVDIIDL